MITYKNYQLPYKADEILEHTITGSTATAEEWLADVKMYEEGAYCDVEEELASDDIDIDTLKDHQVQELVEERVQDDMDNYLVPVSGEDDYDKQVDEA